MGAHDYFSIRLHLKIKTISQKNTFSAWYRQREDAEQTEDIEDIAYLDYAHEQDAVCSPTVSVVSTFIPEVLLQFPCHSCCMAPNTYRHVPGGLAMFAVLSSRSEKELTWWPQSQQNHHIDSLTTICLDHSDVCKHDW